MTTAVLVRTCFVSACANTLFNKRDSNPLNLRKATVVARRSTRHHTTRSRRHSLTPAAASGRRRRTLSSVYHPDSLRKSSHSLIVSGSAARRAVVFHCASRGADEMDEMVLLQRSLDQTTRRGASTPEEGRPRNSGDEAKPRRLPEETLASPTSNIDDSIENRSTRSASTASRSTNRLSLTLPIVPATAFPPRPTPVSSTAPAFPPTPLDTPLLMSPVDPNDFITAIAAQERRVLELREELSRAESDLTRLKKQWANHEVYKKRAARRNNGSISGLGPAAELHDETVIRRSVEVDRRKALLGQQSQLATPERSRRRVFTGSHTRTLSLLSPTKTTGEFPEDEPGSAKPEADSRFAPAATTFPAKRASWASRPTQATGTGMKQLAEDLKSGIWTFMEDLRQATVGDEPITGQGTYMRGMDGNMRSIQNAGDQDTIRAPGNSRPRATSAFEETPKTSKLGQDDGADAEGEEAKDSEDVPPPKPPRPLQRSKTDAGTKSTKRFSWTPLPMESLDDNDWSNWDSPSTSSPRWSGTTVNGDIIPSIPERDSTPLKKKTSRSRLARSPSPSRPPTSSSASLSPSKLEELLPPVLNRLTPSNIKRAAGDFMKEWERSLSAPGDHGGVPAAVGGEEGA